MERAYFMESERIGFSCWGEDDLMLAQSLWGEQEVSRFITEGGVFTDEQIKAKFKKELDNQGKYGVSYWQIFERQSGEFIGCCGLRLCGLRPVPTEGIFEIGFHLKHKFWGRGLAQEAAQRVIEYAFNNLSAQRLIAGHNPNNVNSKKVLYRLGFTYFKDSLYAPTGLMHPTYFLEKNKISGFWLN